MELSIFAGLVVRTPYYGFRTIDLLPDSIRQIRKKQRERLVRERVATKVYSNLFKFEIQIYLNFFKDL